jgi:inhibitor of cysteine peptidase
MTSASEIDHVKRCALLALAALVIASCAGCAPKMLNLSKTDNGTSVSISKGEHIRIELPANPSTGFTWQPSGLDASMLVQVGQTAYQPSNAIPVPGSGGTQTLEFAAVAAGSTTLTLIYHRPFETGKSPADTFTIQVSVTP